MEFDNKSIKEFIKKVKDHQKYRSISDDIVEIEIEKYLKRYAHDLYDEKFAFKKIRKELHRLYSSYQTKHKKKRNLYLDALKKDPNIENTNDLLSMTLSTKERLPNYQSIYKDIFQLTGKPKTIIDLGSGLNPLSIPYMNLSSITYYSYDINLEDMEFLNKYYKTMKINGHAIIMDIRDLEKISNLPSSDIIFLFKIIDLIDEKSKKKKKISEQLIKLLVKKTKFIVVSFATKTLTRRSMKLPRRIGFELMLTRNNLNFKIINTDNEIFYVIRKF